MKYFLMACAASSALITPHAYAEGDHNHDHHAHHIHATHDGHDHSLSIGKTPASIMGDHVHAKSDWMLSYRFMRMNMRENRNGTDELLPRDIAGNFANTTGVGPATLRIVPTEMVMDMHMLGAMYAPTDRLTLMLMGNYIRKEMDHITFAMADPSQEIGGFSTVSNGWADTKVSALYDLTPNTSYNLVGKLGLNLPTADLDQTGTILNPMGASQTVRLPYAMQIGSGTFDLEPALTYSASHDQWNWGSQYQAILRLGENTEDYTLGDKHILSAWGGYQWNPILNASLRITGEHEGKIDGRDDQISGPVQTADPDNYDGKRVEIGLGFTITPQNAALRGHGIAIEASLPVYQDLNGPQLSRDYGVVARYIYSF